MTTELGSDIALIQDEDMLRKMWQQTKELGKVKEIRMRMHELQKQRQKEFYTTKKIIQIETTSKSSSTESITDQEFMTMKTKEIGDSESPTEDYQQQSNTFNNFPVKVKVEEINKSRKLSGLKVLSVKDRKANFEKNDVAEKTARKYKIIQRNQSPSFIMNTGSLSETPRKSIVVTDNTSENISTSKVTNPNIGKKSPEKTKTINSVDKVSDNAGKQVLSKNPDRKCTGTLERSTVESPEKKLLTNSKVDSIRNLYEQYTATTTTAKTEFGVTTETSTAPKDMSTTVHTTDNEIQIEETFDLQILEIMLEKTYDRRRRIIAQIRRIERQLEPSKSGKDTINALTRVSKTIQDGSPAKPQKQNNSTTVNKVEFANTQKTVIKKDRSISPLKSHLTPNSNSRSHSPQKATTRSFEEFRSMLPQNTVRQTEKARSSSPQKTVTQVEKVRSPSPQKSIPVVKDPSPSPKIMSFVKQQDSWLNKNDKSNRNSTVMTFSSTSVITTSKGKENGSEITDITEEFNNSDQIDNKSAEKKNTKDKFESIRKKFSQESFNRDSSRSFNETNGYEQIEGSPQSTPKSSLVRGDSIKALQHKLQQATEQGNWSNQFGRIKATVERDTPLTTEVSPNRQKNVADQYWNNICKCQAENTIPYREKKNVFNSVGSNENGSSHVHKFEPVEKVQKPTAPVPLPLQSGVLKFWNQMIVGQSNDYGKVASRSTAAGGSAAVGKLQRLIFGSVAPYGGYMTKEEISHKQNLVRRYFGSIRSPVKQRASSRLVKLSEDINKVDETFEILYKEACQS